MTLPRSSRSPCEPIKNMALLSVIHFPKLNNSLLALLSHLKRGEGPGSHTWLISNVANADTIDPATSAHTDRYASAKPITVQMLTTWATIWTSTRRPINNRRLATNIEEELKPLRRAFNPNTG